MTEISDLDWYKGSFAGIAPIWLADPDGDCYVDSRGILGFVLLPIAEFLIQSFIFINSAIDPEYEPLFPIAYDDREVFKR